MDAIRNHVLYLRQLPICVRFFSAIFIFIIEEAFIISLHDWGFSSILLILGLFICWVFSWKEALALEWGLLWIHIVLLTVYQGWSIHVLAVFISGTVTDLILVISIGAFRSAMDRLQEFHQIKDQFLANLNHDMRTPLTTAIGSIGILREYGAKLSAPEQQMFLDQASYSCDEVARLTSNIRDAMTAIDDVSPPQLEAFHLDQVVKELLRYIYTFEHPLVDLHIPTGVEVLADITQVQRVLRNLLHNAFKYAAKGTPISVKIGINEGAACVCIKDQGYGIDPEKASQLFQKFSRLHDERHVDGTGLGLYNCRRMVENMGGQIWVESSGIEGEGSSFYFTLPLFCPSMASNQLGIDIL
ncbi:MAG TPA: HAMP domain-containing sensor histidine kinase [Ktedonobacteraceae bacterium]|jgi:signal transduction histidine kinase|nr:HAMP domain-containing sensor histidine kinase [Ktedonobacteraceae bacterium]